MSEDILSVKLETLHADVGEVKAALNRLSDAITKLALVEQQQGQISQALERAFKAIGKLEETVSKDLENLDDRVTAVEMAQPAHSETAKWVDRGLVALAGAGAAMLAKGVGLL
jgi:predicted ATPase